MDYDLQMLDLLNQQADPEIRSRMETVAPALVAIAAQLGQYHFFVPAGPDGDWVITTYGRKRQTKRVLEVFSLRQAAQDRLQGASETVVSVGSVELVLMLLLDPAIDSLVAYRKSQSQGLEITKAAVMAGVQAFFQALPSLFA